MGNVFSTPFAGIKHFKGKIMVIYIDRRAMISVDFAIMWGLQTSALKHKKLPFFQN
jgi:hypothetical protein